MAEKSEPKAKKRGRPKATKSDPLIKKLSEVIAMTKEEKIAFRKKGGTTIQG